MYQVGYVKGEAEPYILCTYLKIQPLKKKDKGCDFVKKCFSHTLMWEIDTERTRVLDLAKSWAIANNYKILQKKLFDTCQFCKIGVGQFYHLRIEVLHIANI